HPGVFRVAAVDCSPEATHQCGDFGADRKLSTRTRVDDADAFDAADFGGFGPFPATHVQLGVVDAEPADLDDHFAVSGQRLWDVGVDQAVESAELLQHGRAHGLAARPFADHCGCGGQG